MRRKAVAAGGLPGQPASGHVYRGKRLPELDGYYLYGDYITNKIWALRYDDAKKRVT